MRVKTLYKMQNDMTFAWKCFQVKASYILTWEFTPMKSLLSVLSKVVEWASIKKETFSSITVECMQKHSKTMISEALTINKIQIKSKSFRIERTLIWTIHEIIVKTLQFESKNAIKVMNKAMNWCNYFQSLID